MRRMLVVAVLVTMAGCATSRTWVRVDDTVESISAPGPDTIWVVDRRTTTTTRYTYAIGGDPHTSVTRKVVDRIKRCEMSQGLLICFEPKRR